MTVASAAALSRTLIFIFSLSILAGGVPSPRQAQSPDALPLQKEVRGYKVEQAEVKVRKGKGATRGASEPEQLIRFDAVHIERVTPLGLTLSLKATVAPVSAGGEVEMLVFEDVRVNGTPVEVEDYKHPFRLPDKKPLALAEPFKLYVSSPRIVIETLGDLVNPPRVLPVTGRVYVCGRFKKFLMSFKRAVPIELKTAIANPF